MVTYGNGRSDSCPIHLTLALSAFYRIFYQKEEVVSGIIYNWAFLDFTFLPALFLWLELPQELWNPPLCGTTRYLCLVRHLLVLWLVNLISCLEAVCTTGSTVLVSIAIGLTKYLAGLHLVCSRSETHAITSVHWSNASSSVAIMVATPTVAWIRSVERGEIQQIHLSDCNIDQCVFYAQ